MLGWQIFILRQAPKEPANTQTLASWEAGLGGLAWLDDLVKAGRATCLGGDGYPLRYTANSTTVAAAISHGPPHHKGPVVLGEDYITPSGWIDGVVVDRSKLDACAPDEELLIEAWDLS